jgi:hypothetical protein
MWWIGPWPRQADLNVEQRIYFVNSPGAVSFHYFRDCQALARATHDILEEAVGGWGTTVRTEAFGDLSLCPWCRARIEREAGRDVWQSGLRSQRVDLQGQGDDLVAEYRQNFTSLLVFEDRLELLYDPLLGRAQLEKPYTAAEIIQTRISDRWPAEKLTLETLSNEGKLRVAHDVVAGSGRSRASITKFAMPARGVTGAVLGIMSSAYIAWDIYSARNQAETALRGVLVLANQTVAANSAAQRGSPWRPAWGSRPAGQVSVSCW